MRRAIERMLANSGGRFACVVVRMQGAMLDELVSLNPTLRFPAASLAKVPILVEVARQVEQGLLSWKTHYSLVDEARVSSSGVLANLSPDWQPTLRDLAHLMITISDNTAANMLLHLVGFEAVNTTMQQLGLQATRLERYFMDFAARQRGLDNWTTAGDMAGLFSLLCSHSLPASQDMLEILLLQNDYTLLSAYWGEALPFAHKTGDLAGVTHDAGILFPPLVGTSPENASLIIVVLTAELADQPMARYWLARIGKLIYQP